METENPAKNLDNTGLVILYGRVLESTLRQLGATGTGAGEMVNSIKKNIPQSLFRDISYMMHIRNLFAHAGTEAGNDVPEDFDPEDYKEFAESVIRRLRRLAGPAPQTSSAREKREKQTEEMPEELAPEVVEFMNFKAEMRRRIMVMGCIPLFNWFYFLFLVLASFKRAAAPLFILILTLFSLPPFINGFATADHVHIACGAALALAGYIWSVTIFNNMQQKPSWFWWLPLMHILYIFRLLGIGTDWKRFILGAIGLAMDIAAIAVLFTIENPWKYFFIYTATAFVLSLGHLIFFNSPERGCEKK